MNPKSRENTATHRSACRWLAPVATLLASAPALRAQDLEQRVEELERKVDSVAGEVERFELRDVMPPVGESEWGLGPAASKVYQREQGLSIGGYGEFLLSAPAGETDNVDALRAITYIGYKFDEHWLFNSEIEFEHGTTEETSGTDDEGGSVSLEFGYLDYLHSESLGFRAGLVLMPMGLINEIHEPTTFLSANRPQTELRILPTTWRENGVGVFGDAGGFEYRAYVVNGLNGAEFSASGLRDSRQSGSHAAVDDAAVVGRLDWVDTPGLMVGGSIYYGEADQDSGGLPDMPVAIGELHVDYRPGPWRFRALGAMADIDDADEFNAITGENLADELEGYYVEAGFDLLAGHEKQSLTPFLRWEHVDTQASLPSGFTADSSQDDEILTFGLDYQPIDQIVLKLDYQDWDDDPDVLSFLIGYVF